MSDQDFLPELPADFLLSGINLQNKNFDGLNLIGCKFAGCNLTGSSFKNCTLRGVDFSGAIIKGCDFTDADLKDCSFALCDFKNVIGDGVYIKNSKVLRRFLITYTYDVVQIACKQKSVEDWLSCSKEELVAMYGDLAVTLYEEHLNTVHQDILKHPAKPFKD